MTSAARLLAALVLCASAALAACDGDGPAGPGEPLTGRYLLHAVDGRPLPHVISSVPTEEHTLLAEAITFHASGRATRERTSRRLRALEGRDTTYTLVARAEYRRSGTRVEIGFFRPCPPNASCPANDVGTVEGEEMVLASGLYRTRPGAAPVLAYTRP
ncbi:MAG TPA: hypothetical protein VFQ76_01830 [Longimicrobiaceae bacterium]|nr:hypothetical protein [Longimicrobiaceae bacterium]